MFANEDWIWEADVELKYDFLFGKSPAVLGEQSQLKIDHESFHQVKVYNWIRQVSSKINFLGTIFS